MSSSEWKPNQQKFGAQYKLIGKDYPTPDLYAKVLCVFRFSRDLCIQIRCGIVLTDQFVLRSEFLLIGFPLRARHVAPSSCFLPLASLR